MIRRLLLALPIVFLLYATGCGSDSPTGPATEHHADDVSIDNGDGTTSHTVAGVDFTTRHRDFSGEPVDTLDRTVSASLDDTFTFPATVEQFRVFGDTVFASLYYAAFNNELVVHDLATDTELSSHAPDFFVAGFDYNGAIMTVDGSSNLNFYRVENGVIADHFFHLEDYNSPFATEAYIDEDRGYVFDADHVKVFPLSDTGQSRTAFGNLSSADEVGFSADEDVLYVSVGGFSSSTIRYYDKHDYTLLHEIAVPGLHLYDVVVDANYIYATDRINHQVHVWNKRTYHKAGFFAAPGAYAIDVVGGTVYVSDEDSGDLNTFSVTFS